MNNFDQDFWQRAISTAVKDHTNIIFAPINTEFELC